MSKVIPGTARAAVTAGLSAALALGTLPASAIADAIVEPEAGASQEQVQTQQDAQAGQDAPGEAEGEDADGAIEGTAAASGGTAATEGEDTAEGADPEMDNVADPETAATAEASADAAANADAASEETKASEVPPATAQEAPAADAPADATPIADEVAKITHDGVETPYDSLTTAVNNLQDNDTLTILKTVSDNVEINNKQNVTITSTDKTAVAYQGYMKIRGGNGNKVTNIHFDVQPQLNQTTGTTSFSHRGLELFDAPNVKVENNTFTLPEDGPNTTQTVTRLDVNCLYVSGTSGGLEVRNNSFHISKHGSPNYNMTYRAIALRGHDIRVPGNNKVLDGVTIDGNTIEMTGRNSQGNATSVFVDAVGGLTNPKYGIKNVVVNNNTINGGQTTSDGTTNVTFGFLTVGIDGLTFTNNTAKKLGYAVIFGADGTGTNRTQLMDNVKIGGNDLSTTVCDLYTSANNKQDDFENHVGDGGIILTAPERGKADNSAFYAGYRDLSNSQYELHLHSSLAKALEKVEDGKPYEVRVIQDATTGVPVPDGKDVTLDLNGNTVSGANAVTGKLTVKDSSTGTAGTLSGATNVTGTGQLTVESGTVGAAVTSAAGTSVMVTGGTVTGPVTLAGMLNVNGGTVSGKVTGNAGSTIAVTDGTVSGDVTTAGAMNVTGGTVTGKIVAQSGANVTISGGAVGEVEAQPGATVTITGVVTGNGDTANGTTVRIEGGEFEKAPTGKEGVVTITGGSFSEKPDVLHSENLKGFALGADGKWNVVDASLSITNAVTNANGIDTYTIDIKVPCLRRWRPTMARPRPSRMASPSWRAMISQAGTRMPLAPLSISGAHRSRTTSSSMPSGT